MQDKVTSLEKLCAHITFNNVSSIDLHSRDLKLENSISTYVTTKFMVWRASPTGCAVHSGTIHIPKGSTLLLDGYGAHFSKVRFSGMQSLRRNSNATRVSYQTKHWANKVAVRSACSLCKTCFIIISCQIRVAGNLGLFKIRTRSHK